MSFLLTPQETTTTVLLHTEMDDPKTRTEKKGVKKGADRVYSAKHVRLMVATAAAEKPKKEGTKATKAKG